MRVTCSIAIMLALFGSAASVARGQAEAIGPFDMPGPQDDKGFGPFDNDIPPDPDYKDFAFEGTAFNPGPLGNIRDLGIYFDYVNAQGQQVPLLAPNGLNLLSPGVNNISASVTLDWCPEEVSIHFETYNGSVLDIQGVFTHTCYPEEVLATAPTISEWGMVALTLLLLTGIGIKFGRRGTVKMT